MKLLHRTLIFLISATALAGCATRQDKPQKAAITRLDEIVAEFPHASAEKRDSITAAYALPIGDYLYMMGLTSPDLQGSIDTLASSAAYAVFMPDIKSRFSNQDSVENALGSLNRHFKNKLNFAYKPIYYSVISPYRQPIMTVDSMVFIALNHYLGDDYAGYESMPRYQLKTKNPQHITYDVAEALIQREYPTTEFGDLSQRLLREGAVTYAVMQLIPGSTIAAFLGWDDRQAETAKGAEQEAWEQLASSGLLFSTDPIDGDRLFSPAPATAILSPQLPGRMGRFIGLKIVESYIANNPDRANDFGFLLSPDFYADPQSLVSASYNPAR